MSRRFLWSSLLLVSLGCVHAQDNSQNDRELIQQLLQRIDTLEKRVAELEKERTSVSAQPAAATAHPVVPAIQPPPAVSTTQAVHMAHETAPLPDAEQPTYPTLKIAGFADFDFAATNLHGASGGFGQQTLLNSHSGFEEGQFTLQMNSALSAKVSAFTEITLTPRTDAGTGSPATAGFNPEVERIIIRYDWNDYFKVSFGRYHTPINYWNTAFHHGQWLQTTISRPEMTQFGGGFIPVHFVGTLVEGVVPARGLNLNYNFGVGNGRSSVISRGGDFGDINNNRAWLVNGFIKPSSLYGLQVGGSVYRDEVTLSTAPAAREWIESAHIVWLKETPEFIAEFANVQHAYAGNAGTFNSQAGYVQTAYRLPWNRRLWKPYYRWEFIHAPASDLIFRPVPTFSASTAGMRYDISSFAALKLEYRYYSRRALPSIQGIFMQTSFTF